MTKEQTEAQFINEIACEASRSTLKQNFPNCEKLTERLARRALIKYDKATKKWSVTGAGLEFVAEHGRLGRMFDDTKILGFTSDVTNVKHIVNEGEEQSYPGQEESPQSDQEPQEKEMKSNSPQDIDAAINEAKAKRAESGKDSDDSQSITRPKRQRLSPIEREARNSQRSEAQVLKRLARVAKREEKARMRAETKSVPHMKKVERALASLPALTQDAEQVLNQVTTGVDAMRVEEVQTLALHLLHFIRAESVKRAAQTPVTEGTRVVIVSSSNPKFVNRQGVVTAAQRIRCYVQVEGFEKPVYCYTSDVRPVSDVAQVDEEASASTGS